MQVQERVARAALAQASELGLRRRQPQVARSELVRNERFAYGLVGVLAVNRELTGPRSIGCALWFGQVANSPAQSHDPAILLPPTIALFYRNRSQRITINLSPNSVTIIPAPRTLPGT